LEADTGRDNARRSVACHPHLNAGFNLQEPVIFAGFSAQSSLPAPCFARPHFLLFLLSALLDNVRRTYFLNYQSA